jgi:hypothetical protein
MGARKHPFDFNLDGLAHFGLVPDMLQDLKNLGMAEDNFAALFSSAEAYLKMWQKTWDASACGSASNCRFRIGGSPSRVTCDGSHLNPPR